MKFDVPNISKQIKKLNFIKQFEYYDEIDSTNSYLLKKQNLTDKTLVLAEFQFKGKGRLERKWLANAYENLTFSIGLKPKLPANELGYLNFCTSLSIAEAIEKIAKCKVETKWPNDLLLGGKKFCGILIESQFEENQVGRSIIGIGLNVNQLLFQDEFKERTTSLRLFFNKSFKREDVLIKVLKQFSKNHSTLKKNINAIINKWKLRCSSLGKKISLTNNKDIFTGIFEDVTEDGSLILNQNGKLLKLFSGDVTVIKE
ncbi:MAG: biotin--[acetyl-CoA-carboxylase] ligase [Bacteroidetes bacterium]|nr:biotin--[acetyl-CoA-carboxylase] ligase [Bacteroidota bacterium]MBU2585744.1 biotin--[acetyl-CoA-carboxylase] ligase [Bacteroidota bacterium]